MSSKKILYQEFCPIFTSFGNASSTEASDFLTATGITNPTQVNAIRELVNNLKGYGLWTKMKALYPFVGGTATTHKYNLKDPRDLDAAFRLVFNGTWVHSATGAKPNGIDAYADTKLIPSVNLTLYDAHVSYYSRTQIQQSANIEMGVVGDTPSVSIIGLTLPNSTNSAAATHTGQNLNSRLALAIGIINTKGLFVNNRNSSAPTDLRLYVNGVNRATATTNVTSPVLPTRSIYIGAVQNFATGVAFPDFFSSKECAFASIGSSFNTKCDNYNFYKIVELYQTQLSRQMSEYIPTNTLVLGNSITKHPILSYWWGEWGMAASLREKDFVHVLETRLKKSNPSAVVYGRNIADWEANHTTWDKTQLDADLVGRDCVIIRLGENVSNTTGYQASIESLIDYIRTKIPSVKIFTTGNFWVSATKDSIMQAASLSRDCPYVPLSSLDLSINKSVIGAQVYGDDLVWHTVNNSGVASHPNDIGMFKIAITITEAFFT